MSYLRVLLILMSTTIPLFAYSNNIKVLKVANNKEVSFAGVIKNITRINAILENLVENYEKLKRIYKDDEDSGENISKDHFERSRDRFAKISTDLPHTGTPMIVSSEKETESDDDRTLDDVEKNISENIRENVSTNIGKVKTDESRDNNKANNKRQEEIHKRAPSKVKPDKEDFTKTMQNQEGTTDTALTPDAKAENTEDFLKDIGDLFLDDDFGSDKAVEEEDVTENELRFSTTRKIMIAKNIISREESNHVDSSSVESIAL